MSDLKNNKELVSIIVTTKNEEKNIANCLESIKEQSYKNIEIIVVDNNSTDNTKKNAKKYTELVFDKGPERSAQRNYGMKDIATGSFVMYVDADMIFSKNVILDCVKKMKSDSDLVALYISEIIMGDQFFNKVRRFERSFYDGTVIDCVRFIRKDVFTKLNGFDETLTGPEDWDFDKKIRETGKVSVIKTPIYHNEGDFNLKDYLNKKSYYSKSFDKYINKWGKADEDIKRQFGLYYRYFGVYFEKQKWKKCIVNPFLILGMFYLRFRVGIRFLLR